MPVSDQEISEIITQLLDTPEAEGLESKLQDLFARLSLEFNNNSTQINNRIQPPLSAGIELSRHYKEMVEEATKTISADNPELPEMITHRIFIEITAAINRKLKDYELNAIKGKATTAYRR